MVREKIKNKMNIYDYLFPVGKIAKKQSEGVRFCKFGTQNTVPYCKKYTPTECIGLT